MSPSPVRAAAALAALVLSVLFFHEVRPQYSVRAVAWPGHAEPFTLPTYLPGDCPYYRATAHSLLHDRDLDQRNDMNWSVIGPHGQVAQGLRGEWYPKHPILMPVLTLPFYAAFGDDGLLLFNVLQLLALDVLLFLLARRYAPEPLAFATALAFALGTLLRPAAYNWSPDVLSTLLVLGGMLALLSRRAALAGLLLGLGVMAKWTNLIFLPIAALYSLSTLGIKPTVRLALAAAPPLLTLGLLNWHMFGSPLITPYDRALIFPGGQATIEPSHREAFNLPFWRTLGEQMISPSNGLIPSAPFILFALPGFYLIFRRARAESALLFVSCAAQIAIFAPYRHWAASSYGHRFLMTVVALSAAPVAAAVAWALPADK